MEKNKCGKMPLIKETRISILTDALFCFSKHPFNREKQRTCVLEIFKNKEEKSVFRGMVIPTLRYLGLILGYGDAIRLSANGKLITRAAETSPEELVRVFSCIILELDRKKFSFIERVEKRGSIHENAFIDALCPITEHQNKERIVRWLKILRECSLIEIRDDKIILNMGRFSKTSKDLNAKNKYKIFKKNIFDEYKKLRVERRSESIDLTILRESIALKFYNEYKIVLTEDQFDIFLNEIPHVDNKYVISLGHTMGAEEKAFYYKGEPFRTISIKFIMM